MLLKDLQTKGGGGNQELEYTHTLVCNSATIAGVHKVGYTENLFGALIANHDQDFELPIIPYGIYTEDSNPFHIIFDYEGERRPLDQGITYYFGFSDTKQYIGVVRCKGSGTSTIGYVDTQYSLADQNGKTRKIWLANTPPPWYDKNPHSGGMEEGGY